jgi:hypothetical protein
MLRCTGCLITYIRKYAILINNAHMYTPRSCDTQCVRVLRSLLTTRCSNVHRELHTHALLLQHVCCSPYKPWASFIISPASDVVKTAAAHFIQRLHRAGVPVRVNGVHNYPYSAPACGTAALPGTACGRKCSGEATYNYQGLCPDRLVSLHR